METLAERLPPQRLGRQWLLRAGQVRDDDQLILADWATGHQPVAVLGAYWCLWETKHSAEICHDHD